MFKKRHATMLMATVDRNARHSQRSPIELTQEDRLRQKHHVRRITSVVDSDNS
jgi:hypothetical protein